MFGFSLLERFEHPAHVLTTIATQRAALAAIGVVVAIVLAAMSSASTRRRWLPLPIGTAVGAEWSLEAVIRAGLDSVAMLLPWAGARIGMPGIPQGYVGLITAMLLLLASGPDRSMSLGIRLFHRSAGSLVGAAVATPLILCAHGTPSLVFGGLAASVGVVRYIVNRRGAMPRAVSQCILTILLAMAADQFAHPQVQPVFNSLYGILFEVGLLAAAASLWRPALSSIPLRLQALLQRRRS